MKTFYDDDPYSEPIKPEDLVAPKYVNVLDRPEWKPPKRMSTREGADIFRSWPSKGGD